MRLLAAIQLIEKSSCSGDGRRTKTKDLCPEGYASIKTGVYSSKFTEEVFSSDVNGEYDVSPKSAETFRKKWEELYKEFKRHSDEHDKVREDEASKQKKDFLVRLRLVCSCLGSF